MEEKKKQTPETTEQQTPTENVEKPEVSAAKPAIGRPVKTYTPKKRKTPTPFLKIFLTAAVSNWAPGTLQTQNLHIEYRNICPWNTSIDVGSEECFKCEKNMRHYRDTRYPSFTVVCQRHIDKDLKKSKISALRSKELKMRIKEATEQARRMEELNALRRAEVQKRKKIKSAKAEKI